MAKILKEKSVIKTNSETTALKFTVGNNNAMIMQLLRNNYSNPIQTPVQEIISNALDAQKEINNSDQPLNITLPSELSPILKIRDFGPGLSPERLAIFLQYVESTKREDENGIGGYGIGAKAPFLYTDSFTILNYHKGIKHTYLAEISSTPEGALHQLGEEKTKEKDGLEIQIPIKTEDIQQFQNAVYRRTFFLKVKPNILGISKFEISPEYSDDLFMMSGPHGMILKDTPAFLSDLENDIIVVEGVPYSNPWDDKIKPLCSSGAQVLFFKTGEITIPPHREGIFLNESNMSAILARRGKLSDQIKGFVEKSLIHDDLDGQIETFKNITSYFDDSFAPVLNSIKNKNFKIQESGSYSSQPFQVSFNVDKWVKITESFRVKSGSRGSAPKIKEREELDKDLHIFSKTSNGYSRHELLWINDDCPDLTAEEKLRKIQSYFYQKSERRQSYVIQLIKDFSHAHIKLSQMFEVKVKKEYKPRDKNLLVYYRLAWNKNIGGDESFREKHTIMSDKDYESKGKHVIVTTERNNIYAKNLNKYSQEYQNSIILYLISKGIEVLACSKDAKSNFPKAIDFEDVLENPLKTAPLSHEEKLLFLGHINTKVKGLFNLYYLKQKDMLPHYKKIVNPEVRDVFMFLYYMNNVDDIQTKYLTKEFCQKISSKELNKELNEILNKGNEILKKMPILEYVSEGDDEKISVLIDYINGNSK